MLTLGTALAFGGAAIAAGLAGVGSALGGRCRRSSRGRHERRP
jgi:hypothetical protein